MANKIWNKILKNEVARFILSAGAGFLVDIGLYSFFLDHILTHNIYKILNAKVTNYQLAFTVSFFLGVLVNFLMTKYVVFSTSKLAPFKQFIRFFSVAIVGYFANLGVIELLVKDLHMNPYIARPSAALSLFFASFFIHKVFSFSLSLRHHVSANNK